MTNMKATKRALVSSALALFLCFAMLIGTTFAWFTDKVESKNNIIKAGNLDVEFYWADGKTDPTNTTWNDASVGPIFKGDQLWEPGYTDARHLKIVNNGSLALNYHLRIVPGDMVSKLADVIDVYYFETAQQIQRADVTALKGVEYDATTVTAGRLGTLAEIIGGPKNISSIVNGMLEADAEDTLTIVLKMREEAGNEYQGLSAAGEFSIELIATQASFEEDSFDNTYDENATSPAVPEALVKFLGGEKIFYRTGSTPGDFLNATPVEGILNTGYQFMPTESLEAAQKSDYRYWHADFVVSADSTVPANSMMLAGYYTEFCQYIDNDWAGLTSTEDIPANTEIRLVEHLGVTVNWEELCEYGNDGTGFLCGAMDMTGVNAGTTLTVELRLYSVGAKGECANGGGCEHPSIDCETGEYITVGSYKYTFPVKEGAAADIKVVKDAAELQAALDSAEANKTTYINFANDITGNVVATQLANANVVVNGCGFKFNGVMTVFGNGNQTGAETLTIKNVNFVAANGADSCIVSPDRAVNNKYSYSHNVTVENCTFTDPDGVVGCAAIRQEDGGDMNWNVVNCKVDSTMHSLLQVQNVEGQLTVDGCTVNSKNGLNLNSCTNVLIKETTIDTKGYAVRFGVGSGGNLGESKLFWILDSSLKSANNDGDATIIFRASAVDATLILENTTLDGTTKISGNTSDTDIQTK